MTETQVKEKVIPKETAGSKLIYMDDFRQAIAVGVVSGRYVIGWGHGGHAKSLLVDEIFAQFKDDGAEAWGVNCHVAMNPFDIAGGMHPDYTSKGVFDRPNIEQSAWTNADVWKMEEMLDAPPRVLSFIKDMITSGVYRYGGIEIPITLGFIIGLTNHNPDDIGKTDPSVSALLERFPIQVYVGWPHYTSNDFEKMFLKLGGFTNGKPSYPMPTWKTLQSTVPVDMDEETVGNLSEYLGIGAELGAQVSPRTGVYAGEMLTSWASLCGEAQVELEHYDILRFVTGIGKRHKDIMKRLNYKASVKKDQKLLQKYVDEAASLYEKLGGNNPEQAVSVAKTARALTLKVQEHPWQDDTANEASTVREKLKEVENDALAEAGLLVKEEA